MSETLGNERHQRILRAVVEYYCNDPRVLAVLVFGSVARGNWDEHSDLDLDVVLADGGPADGGLADLRSAVEELGRLCAALAGIGERAAVIVPSHADSGDVVLASLMQLSVRYHPLAATSPNIIESMRMLWGRIDVEAIRLAGLANRRPIEWDASVMAGRCVRTLLEADVALRRDELWFAVEMLGILRDTLIELYGRSRGAPRLLHAFQAEADANTQARLAGLLPKLDADSLRVAVAHGCAVLERDLPAISQGTAALTDEQRAVVGQIRARVES